MEARRTHSPQVLSLAPNVAPTKVLVVPLSAKDEFDPLVAEVCALTISSPDLLCTTYRLFVAAKLRRAGVLSRIDDSSVSIGKRYARNDELGTPYGVTLDFACACSLVLDLQTPS